VASAPAPGAPAWLRVLFVGNSYTARHDLPGLVAELAASAPAARAVLTRTITAGGASLRRHWNGGAVHAALRETRWDVVVLQEQSTLPVKNAARFRDNVGAFVPAIRAHGAIAALYLTWARRDAPQSQDVLTDATVEVAREAGALVIPVGVAWQAARATCPDLALFVKDGSHPTPTAAYLSACVFLVALLGIDPTTLPASAPRGVEPVAARRLQSLAAALRDWPAGRGRVSPRR